MDFKSHKEDSIAVKSDLARIDFDFDFNIDIGGSNASTSDYEKEAKRIIEEQEKLASYSHQKNTNRKKLTNEEREVISEIFKSQSDKDILSICEDILRKSQNLDGKNLLHNVLNFLDQIGLFGTPDMLSDIDIDYTQYQNFVSSKYHLKIENAKANIPQYVKAFYEFLLTHY